MDDAGRATSCGTVGGMPRRPGSAGPQPVTAASVPAVHLSGDVPDADVRARRRSGEWLRVRRGAYVTVDDLPRDEHARARAVALAHIRAVGRQLPSRPPASHESAALLWGLPTLRLPRHTHVASSTRSGTEHADDVVRHVAPLDGATTVGPAGLPLTDLHRTTLDCLTSLDPRSAAVAVDAALRAGASVDHLRAALEGRRGRRGTASARRVLDVADDGAESAGESVARLTLLGTGLPRPETQVPVRTADGVVWGDLGWYEWRLLVEYDGAGKYRRTGTDGAPGDPERVLRREKRREELIREAGWRVVRLGSADLRRPHELLGRVLRLAPTGTADRLTPRLHLLPRRPPVPSPPGSRSGTRVADPDRLPRPRAATHRGRAGRRRTRSGRSPGERLTGARRPPMVPAEATWRRPVETHAVPAGARVRDDRLLLAVLVLTVVGVGLVLVELVGRVLWPTPVAHVLTPVVAVLATQVCRRTAADPGLPPLARRIWWTTTAGIGTITLSITMRSVDALLVPLPAPATTVPQVVGAVLLSWSVLRIPLALRTRSERTALLLDLATVLVGAAVVVWHVFGGSAVRAIAGGAAPDVGPVMGAALVAVVLATKASLSGVSVMPRRALQLRAVSALVGGLGAAVSVLLAGRPDVEPQLLLNPIGSATLALSAYFQLTDSRTGDGARRRRPYSTLPYLAVVAVHAALVEAALRGASDLLVLVLASAVLTALVVVRQLIAFGENDRLLRRLGDHEQQLRHDATHDALTGLANRALFGERLEAAVHHADPEHRVSLVLVDLDDFKAVNDTLGHAVGDALLVTVADRMRTTLRSDDTVARLGGDEFAFLVEGLGPADLDRVLTRMAHTLLAPAEVDGHTLVVRASFGVVDGRCGDDAGELMRQADVAMYDAKRLGLGSHRWYRPEMEAGLGAHRHLGTAAAVGETPSLT